MIIELIIPDAVLEAGARAAVRAVEARHGSHEGRTLLGFDTLDAFIDAAWPNYVQQVRESFSAMIESWPGMEKTSPRHNDGVPRMFIIPVTEEPNYD